MRIVLPPFRYSAPTRPDLPFRAYEHVKSWGIERRCASRDVELGVNQVTPPAEEEAVFVSSRRIIE